MINNWWRWEDSFANEWFREGLWVTFSYTCRESNYARPRNLSELLTASCMCWFVFAHASSLNGFFFKVFANIFFLSFFFLAWQQPLLASMLSRAYSYQWRASRVRNAKGLFVDLTQARKVGGKDVPTTFSRYTRLLLACNQVEKACSEIASSPR